MTDKSRTLSAPRDLLERALNSEKGIRIWFETEAKAHNMSNRLRTVKTEDRKKSIKIYSPGDEFYNTSVYDGVAIYTQPVQIHKDPVPDGYPTEGVWLYLCPDFAAAEGYFIENL